MTTGSITSINFHQCEQTQLNIRNSWITSWTGTVSKPTSTSCVSSVYC